MMTSRVRKSLLQCVAVCCSVWQCVAVWGSVWQCVAVRGIAWQCMAVCCNRAINTLREEDWTWSYHCNTPQLTATLYNCLQRTVSHNNSLQHTATHRQTLRHTAKRHGLPLTKLIHLPLHKQSIARTYWSNLSIIQSHDTLGEENQKRRGLQFAKLILLPFYLIHRSHLQI